MRTLFRFVCLAGLILTVAAPPAHAYQRYNDGCQNCHGSFLDNTSTKGSTFPGASGGDKHTMHRSASYMSTSCNLCHSSGDNDNPFIGSSDGITGVPGLGCVGCHDAVGLRKHHTANSVSCTGCHNDTGKTPPAENVNPPYYGTTGTKAKNACNPVAAQYTNENWTVNGFEGLDNDGNNLYDSNDPACGVTCTYTISPSGTNMTSAGGTGSIGVTTTVGASCVWTATPSVVWITINSGSPGNGNGTVNYSVAVNATTLARTGTVTIATKTFTIAQAGACSYSINPTSTNLTAAGGTGNVAVTAGAGCAWTAASNVGWISITGGASGSGNGSVGYSVAANTSSLSRTGTATIAGLTFTVNQAGSACTYVLNPTTQAFTSSGGTGSFSVTAAAGCAWTATSGAAWITTTNSGSGNGTVNLSVGANASSLARTGTITVASQTFTVTQTGVACSYSIAPTNATYAAAGGSGSVNVTAPAGCAWTGISNDAWITVTSGATGSGNGTVGYNVAANASSLARTGTVAIAGKTLTVTQSGATCTYALNPTSQAFTSGGGTGTFGVTTPAGCAWTATTGAAWITTTSSGSGNGTVNFSVGANSSSLARTGTITVASQTFTVTQTGVACSYSIAPTNATYAAAGGSGSVNVTAPVGCAWTAASNAGWINVTSGATGSGNGSVGYNVATNSTISSRSGTMTIAGQTFTVTQSGTSCTYSINPASQAFTSSGGTGTFNVNATTGCAWSAATGDAWITTTSSGSGSGVVNFVVAANMSSLSRTGTIGVAGQTFTVTQTGVACTYSLNPTSQAFTPTGGTGSFSVTAPAGCAWTANTGDAWITTASSGTGNGTVNYSIAANVSIGARTGTVSVAGQTFTVTQSGAGCTYNLSPTNQTFAAAGGPGSANVAAPAGCAWTAASNDAWITITGGASGSGTGTVSYSVDGNASSLTRVGTLTIAGKTLTVTQTGVACTYALTPTGQAFDSNGGSASFNVTAAVGCAWSATANVAWLNVVSTGTNSVVYSAAPNTTSLTRTGTITVATQLFTVIQTGVACTFNVSPLSANFAAGGGGGSLTVSAPGGCAWTAASNDGWIAIASGSVGSGNGTVTFNVGANTSTSSRTGTLTVAGQTFTVTQAGASASVVDLDLVRFRTTRRVRLNGEHDVRIRLWVKNGGTVDTPRLATVIGRQNGVTVFNQTFEVAALVAHGRVRYELPNYKPTVVGEILWAASIADDDPDEDVASDTTNVKFQGED